MSQIQAVQRELATQQIRKNEPKRSVGWRKPIHELYQDLAQHQDWERRLSAMQRDKELMRRCTTAGRTTKNAKRRVGTRRPLGSLPRRTGQNRKDISLRERKG